VAAAHSDGRCRRLPSLLTDDVVLLTPGSSPITKQDFAAGFREIAAKARIESTQDVARIGNPDRV
jgi:hypothetical protein